MFRVNVIYHHFPHYRRPIMRELVKGGKHEYRFWGSLEPVNGIESFKGDELVTVNPLRFSLRGSRWVLRDHWPAALDRSADALLIIGNPNMPATWTMAIAARLTGKKVLFWSHGWLKPEPSLKRRLRNFYFSLADKILVYGERARELGSRSGFPEKRIDTIYNSLDYERAQLALGRIAAGDMKHIPLPQSFFADPNLPLIICTARLTDLCRFDLLFDAAAKLAQQGHPINILLVGDGPERRALEKLARDLGINAHFLGACYDEDMLANLLYHADLTVSPGKIGLTVIHSLTYGTPAITHGNLDQQMPEVEAIEPGITGLLFEQNNVADLALKVEDWLASGRDRAEVRRECQRVVAEKWTPSKQRELIDASIDDLFRSKRAIA
jgi:glycosyltransferase involved in cell wall biosynthesis